jgi:uncharacterized membrane protein
MSEERSLEKQLEEIKNELKQMRERFEQQFVKHEEVDKKIVVQIDLLRNRNRLR